MYEHNRKSVCYSRFFSLWETIIFLVAYTGGGGLQAGITSNEKVGLRLISVAGAFIDLVRSGATYNSCHVVVLRAICSCVFSAVIRLHANQCEPDEGEYYGDIKLWRHKTCLIWPYILFATRRPPNMATIYCLANSSGGYRHSVNWRR